MSSQHNHPSAFGMLLKKLLKEKTVSMRQLSKLTGLDTATISRIANGKQQVKLDQIQLMAKALAIPVEMLLQSSGFPKEEVVPEQGADIHSSIRSIGEMLSAYSNMKTQFSVDQVRQELNKYEQYALTAEGETMIFEEFPVKIEAVKGVGPFIEQLRDMYKLYCKEESSPEEKAIVGAALLYFILSVDIIPDYMFPLGYLDDAIAVQLTLEKLAQK